MVESRFSFFFLLLPLYCYMPNPAPKAISVEQFLPSPPRPSVISMEFLSAFTNLPLLYSDMTPVLFSVRENGATPRPKSYFFYLLILDPSAGNFLFFSLHFFLDFKALSLGQRSRVLEVISFFPALSFSHLMVNDGRKRGQCPFLSPFFL